MAVCYLWSGVFCMNLAYVSKTKILKKNKKKKCNEFILNSKQKKCLIKLGIYFQKPNIYFADFLMFSCCLTVRLRIKPCVFCFPLYSCFMICYCLHFWHKTEFHNMFYGNIRQTDLFWRVRYVTVKFEETLKITLNKLACFETAKASRKNQ